MHFQICRVERYMSPQSLNADAILKGYRVSVRDMDHALKSAEFIHNGSGGFQKELAKQLPGVLENLFCSKGAHPSERRYSPAMREEADVAVGQNGSKKRIFIEIEFRPNEHKDLVKFLTAHRHQQLELGILIVAIDRKEINKDYHTMPQYKKCLRTIEELRDECPILLIGIGGEWVGSASASSEKHTSFRVDDRYGVSV